MNWLEEHSEGTIGRLGNLERRGFQRDHFESVHLLFRDAFQRFVATEVLPNNPKWNEARICNRSMFSIAGQAGFLRTQVEENYGGSGADDFRFNQITMEEFELAGVGSAGSSGMPHLIERVSMDHTGPV